MRLTVVLQALAFAYAGITAAASINNRDPVIEKDVLIVGAGSSGVYTGVKLHEAGKKVLIVESTPVIGGHANTYTDPKTGTKITMGVVVFHNTSTVRDYFGRFNVSLIPSDSAPQNTSYVDFATGKVNKGFAPPSNAEFGAALQGYAALLSKWPSVQTGFNLTYPVDPDLLLPFGELLAKYNLTGVSYNAYLFAQGYSPLMNLSSIYVIKNFGFPLLTELAGGLLTTASHDTRQLYDAILKELPDIFMTSTSVCKVTRTLDGNGVQIQLKQNGKDILVNAKKIVWTAPPTLSNLDSANFDLTKTERSLFGKFFANGYFTSLLSKHGLPANTSLSASSPTTPFQIGSVPGPYGYSTIDGLDLAHVYYGTASPNATDAEVKQDILSDLKKYKQANGVKSTTEPEFAAFYNHSPFNLMVSNDAIRNKFYEKLYALQGKSNTFWNGAAWHVQDSGLLWAFTDTWILPIILASL